MFKNSDAIDKDLDYFFDLERDVQGKMLGFVEQNRKVIVFTNFTKEFHLINL